MGLDVGKAFLISLFLESTLYGLFLCLYVISNAILFQRRKERRINSYMIMITFVMLCLSTVHIGFDIQWILNGFINPKSSTSLADYFGKLNTPFVIINVTSYGAQTIVGDAFLIYRLYLVWQNKWITIPFICSTLASAGVTMAAANLAAHSPASALVISPPFRQYPLTFTPLTLVTNGMCTILIAGKIWWVNRKTTKSSISRTGGPNLASPMVLIVESGALYSICLVFQIALYASRSTAYVLILNPMPSIIGINFSLIIVRVGLGLSAFGAGASSGRSNKQSSSLFDRFTSAPSGNSAESSARLSTTPQSCLCGRGIAMRPLEVHITQTTRNFREPRTGTPSIEQDNSSVHTDDAKALEHQV